MWFSRPLHAAAQRTHASRSPVPFVISEPLPGAAVAAPCRSESTRPPRTGSSCRAAPHSCGCSSRRRGKNPPAAAQAPRRRRRVEAPEAMSAVAGTSRAWHRGARARGRRARGHHDERRALRHERRSRASRLAIKEDELFLYTDELGQVPGTENSALGLYYRDTRYLSRWSSPSPAVSRCFSARRADRGYCGHGGAHQPRGAGADGACYPRPRARAAHPLRCRPPATSAARAQLPSVQVQLVLDLIERRLRRPLRGTRQPPPAPRTAGWPRRADGTLTLAYLGRDERPRTRSCASRPPRVV